MPLRHLPLQLAPFAALPPGLLVQGDAQLQRPPAAPPALPCSARNERDDGPATQSFHQVFKQPTVRARGTRASQDLQHLWDLLSHLDPYIVSMAKALRDRAPMVVRACTDAWSAVLTQPPSPCHGIARAAPLTISSATVLAVYRAQLLAGGCCRRAEQHAAEAHHCWQVARLPQHEPAQAPGRRRTPAVPQAP